MNFTAGCVLLVDSKRLASAVCVEKVRASTASPAQGKAASLPLALERKRKQRRQSLAGRQRKRKERRRPPWPSLERSCQRVAVAVWLRGRRQRLMLELTVAGAVVAAVVVVVCRGGARR